MYLTIHVDTDRCDLSRCVRYKKFAQSGETKGLITCPCTLMYLSGRVSPRSPRALPQKPAVVAGSFQRCVSSLTGRMRLREEFRRKVVDLMMTRAWCVSLVGLLTLGGVVSAESMTLAPGAGTALVGNEGCSAPDSGGTPMEAVMGLCAHHDDLEGFDAIPECLRPLDTVFSLSLAVELEAPFAGRRWSFDDHVDPIAAAAFVWDEAPCAAVVAWHEFQHARGTSAPALPGFQGLRWDGTQWRAIDSRSVVQMSDFDAALVVIPIPPAVGLGLAGLAAILIVGRFRRAIFRFR